MSALAFLLAAAQAQEPPPESSPETSGAEMVGAAVEVTEPPAPRWPRRFPGQCEPDDPHFDLEIAYTEGRYAEGLKLVEARLAENPKDVVLHWMKVRFMYEIGERFGESSEVDRVGWYKKMIAVAEAGLELAPSDVHLHFGRGVSMGRLGTTRGVLASLFMAKDVERDWLFVAEHPTFEYATLEGGEMLPCDAFHALGIFYRLVPDWWIVQVIAGTRGSMPRSLEFNRKSVQCKPDRIQNWKELAATQYCIATKDDDEAMRKAGDASVARGLALPVVDDVHRIDQRHLRQLKEDPSLGCGYSRDGQQDLDEKKLDKD